MSVSAVNIDSPKIALVTSVAQTALFPFQDGGITKKISSIDLEKSIWSYDKNFVVHGLTTNNSSVAASNTSLIQTALTSADGGGVVVIPPASGIIYITNPSNSLYSSLLIGKNTTLSIGKGTTITLAPQSNCYMIRNNDTVNGNACVSMYGGGTFNGDYTNQTLNSNWSGICIFLMNCDDLVIHDLNFLNFTGYAILLNKGMRPNFNHIHFSTHKDGIHLTGQVYDFVVQNITGSTDDNSVAVLTDRVGYSITDDPSTIFGPCSRGVIRDIFVTCPQPIRIVGSDGTQLGSSGWYLTDIVIENVKGVATQTGAISIGDDTFVSGYSNCKYDYITVRDVDMTMTSDGASPLITLNGKNIQHVKLFNLTANTTANNRACVVLIGSLCTGIKELVIDGVNRVANDLGNNAQIYNQGVIETLKISNVRMESSGTSSGFGMIRNAGTVTNMEVRGTYLDDASYAAQTLLNSGVITYLNMSNVYQNRGLQVINWTGSGTAVNLENITGVGGASHSQPIISVNTGGSLPRLNANNIHRDKGYDVFEIAADAAAGSYYWQISNVYSNKVIRMFHLCVNSHIQLTNAVNDGVNDDSGTNYLVQTDGGTSTLQRFNVQSINSANAGGLFSSGTCTISGTA